MNTAACSLKNSWQLNCFGGKALSELWKVKDTSKREITRYTFTMHVYAFAYIYFVSLISEFQLKYSMQTHAQLKFPELTELGLEFLETKGEQTFYVHPEADMLLSANRPKSFSTFSEWGRGWADPEIRRQRLENMQCNRKPFNAGGKSGRRKSRKQRHSPNLRTARGRIEAKLSKKGARPRSLKH